jgi:two-component system chemotaxis response regulator CheB
MFNSKKPDYYITIGASAGGLNATTELISQLTEDMNVAVFVCLHLSKVGLGNFLIHRLQKYTPYKCKLAIHGDKIEANTIYLAPPDEHLLINDDEIMLGSGPAENRWRPSIDVLFRSAAAYHGEKTIGIILTGYLNDGTSGMLAIKRSGGYCVVQDPNEAEYPDMPLSVLESTEADFCVSLHKMGETIQQIISTGEVKGIKPPDDVVAEAQIAENVAIDVNLVSELGEYAMFSCPDCGGGLWQLKDDKMDRYRCHVGHVYSRENLLLKHSESLEGTLWVALRMMEERRNLLNSISEKENGKGLQRLGQSHKQRADEMQTHIEKLKEVLFSTQRHTGIA